MNQTLDAMGRVLALTGRQTVPAGPVLNHLSSVLGRHCVVSGWAEEHKDAVRRGDPEHDINIHGARCLLNCLADEGICGHCPGDVPWPCPDAADALRLLAEIEKANAVMAAESPRPTGASVSLARLTTMGVQPGDRHFHWRVEDAIAVYLWAEASTRPGPGTNTIAYPSLNEARDFLAAYREARETSWES